MPRAQIDGLGLRWSVAEIPAGNTILSQDDDSRDVMFLLSGRLIAVYWTAEGREVVFTRFPIGSSLGELSAIDEKARSLAIFAKTDARLLRLEQASYLRLIDDVPLIRERILHDLVVRIRSLTDKTLELTTLSIDKRVRLFLVASRDRGQQALPRWQDRKGADPCRDRQHDRGEPRSGQPHDLEAGSTGPDPFGPTAG